ncbi:hypothetical protein [Merismopedia glauca]|nr:hypothetical protein [Merismopedia glauca]
MVPVFSIVLTLMRTAIAVVAVLDLGQKEDRAYKEIERSLRI